MLQRQKRINNAESIIQIAENIGVMCKRAHNLNNLLSSAAPSPIEHTTAASQLGDESSSFRFFSLRVAIDVWVLKGKLRGLVWIQSSSLWIMQVGETAGHSFGREEFLKQRASDVVSFTSKPLSFFLISEKKKRQVKIDWSVYIDFGVLRSYERVKKDDPSRSWALGDRDLYQTNSPHWFHLDTCHLFRGSIRHESLQLRPNWDRRCSMTLEYSISTPMYCK